MTRLAGQAQTACLHMKPPFLLTRVQRRSVVHYTDRYKGNEKVHRGEQEDTFNAAMRPHGGPWLTYLRSKRNQSTKWVKGVVLILEAYLLHLAITKCWESTRPT